MHPAGTYVRYFSIPKRERTSRAIDGALEAIARAQQAANRDIVRQQLGLPIGDQRSSNESLAEDPKDARPWM